MYKFAFEQRNLNYNRYNGDHQLKRLYTLASLVTGVLLVGLLMLHNGGQDANAQIGPPPATWASNNYPQPAPKFYGSADDWLNTNGKPLSMQTLTKEHKVVLVDFWEYTCVNCIRTLPYLREWNKRYAKDGLVIVGIHTPEFKFAHKRANVLTAIGHLGITWPVLVDSSYKNWDAWQGAEGFWPRDYLVNANGQVVEDHAGEGGYGRTEQTIQQLLLQVHPNLKFPPIMAPVHSADKIGARCFPMTPETYCGERGYQSGVLGDIPNFQVGQTLQLPVPTAPLVDGVVYPVGTWITQAESLQNGQTTTNLADRILLKYHAITANAVIRPKDNKVIRVFILQDGKPVPPQNKGQDIRYTPTGQSYLLVNQPRMYNIIRNKEYGSHILTLASNSSAFDLYSFTFTSCEE